MDPLREPKGPHGPILRSKRTRQTLCAAASSPTVRRNGLRKDLEELDAEEESKTPPPVQKKKGRKAVTPKREPTTPPGSKRDGRTAAKDQDQAAGGDASSQESSVHKEEEGSEGTEGAAAAAAAAGGIDARGFVGRAGLRKDKRGQRLRELADDDSDIEEGDGMGKGVGAVDVDLVHHELAEEGKGKGKRKKKINTRREAAARALAEDSFAADPNDALWDPEEENKRKKVKTRKQPTVDVDEPFAAYAANPPRPISPLVVKAERVREAAMNLTMQNKHTESVVQNGVGDGVGKTEGSPGAAAAAAGGGGGCDGGVNGGSQGGNRMVLEDMSENKPKTPPKVFEVSPPVYPPLYPGPAVGGKPPMLRGGFPFPPLPPLQPFPPPPPPPPPLAPLRPMPFGPLLGAPPQQHKKFYALHPSKPSLTMAVGQPPAAAAAAAAAGAGAGAKRDEPMEVDMQPAAAAAASGVALKGRAGGGAVGVVGCRGLDGSYWQVQLGGKRRPEAAKSLSSVSEVGGIAKRTRAKAKGGGGGKPPKPKAKAKARGRKGKNGGRRGIVDELDEPAEPPRPPTMQEQADAIGREAVRMARPWERFALFIRVSDAPNVCRMTTVMPLPRAPLPQVQVQPPPPRDDPMEMG